jgi:hypothetical protein
MPGECFPAVVGSLCANGDSEMTTLRRSIPKLTVLVLALAGLAVPASATITYTSCSSGCSSTTGTYAIWQTASGSDGLTFSMSPATFALADLVSGVYTDPTGTVFTGYSGASIDNLAVSGSALAQTISGTGSAIQLTLPANTFAVAFTITTVSGFGDPMVAVNNSNLSGSNYTIVIPNSSSTEFFGLISSTAINSIYVGNLGSGGAPQINDFELGQSSPTPEVPSVALIGSGLVLFGLLRRRVHKPDGTVA